jgi:DNA-binding winged helix-turn-helix (wHTH) protein/TolB-like protein/Tfp pilus assembly protein PilF
MFSQSRQLYEFGPFQVDPDQRQLLRQKQPIPLQPKAFDILLLLVQNSEKVVLKDDLMKKVWPDTFVEESNLTQHIFVLRRALGDGVDERRYIITVPGRGYRFAESVRAVSIETRENRTEEIKRTENEEQIVVASRSVAKLSVEQNKRSEPRWWIAVGTALLLIAGGLGLSVLRGRMSKVDAGDAPIQSIAVLPFSNLSGDVSKEYFADGFTDQLTTDIAERTRARVVSRTSVMRYKDSKTPVPDIARQLGVDAVVEGSVMVSDQRVRVTVQLIAASVDKHLWAETFEREREDLFSVESELAATIANLIGSQTNGRPDVDRPSAVAAKHLGATGYELSLQCAALRDQGTVNSVDLAVKCYEHILKLEPDSALAYAGIANAYLAVASEKALDPALKAMALDPSLPEAHLAIADYKMEHDLDLAGAEREFKQSISLNPSYAQAHIGYADALVAAGHRAQAMSEARSARQLDPFSAAIAVISGRVAFFAGQYDQVIAEEKVAQDLDPSRWRAYYWMGYAYEQKGMYQEALAQYQKALADEDDFHIYLAAQGRSYVLSRDTVKAAEARAKIEEYSRKGEIWPYDAALFFAASGDRDRAFEWLNNENGGWLIFVQVDPRVASLRSDPRFDALVRRVGLRDK